MSSVNSHPSDGDWLRFADGELSAKEEKQLRAHLAACWQCRAALDDIQRAVTGCVEYRDSVLRQACPEPPQPWFDIYREFDRIEEKAATRSWFARLSDWLAPSAWTPRRTAFSGIALALIVALVWQSWNLPSVQAATLLRRAVARADAKPLQVKRIRIKTRRATITRTLGRALQPARSADLDTMEVLFRQARYDWDDPLSARAFQRWRAQLGSHRDEVTSVLDAPAPEARYHRIRTTTSDDGDLVAASLTLRASDLEPTAGTLEFRNHDSIEIEALPAEPAAAIASTAVESPVPAPAPHAPEPVVAPPTLTDELLVIKALHDIGADLGQPVQITRTSDAVQVTGVGVPPERKEELHAALDSLPRVRLQFSDAGPASLSVPERHLSNNVTQSAPGVERLQARLEATLGGHDAFTQAADRALESSDNLMTRIHALRRLAERYPTDVEKTMTPADRAILAGLRRDHAAAIRARSETLQTLLRSALRSIAGKVDPHPAALAAGPWQAQTEQLFTTSRQVDVLLAGALAAAPAALPAGEIPAELLARLADLKVQADTYDRMAREVQ